jgi:hypothetical protein
MFGWLFEVNLLADDEISCSHGMEHTVPEECRCHSYDDGEATEVESEARTGNNGEGHVQLSTGGTVETQWDGDGERSEDKTVDGLPPRKTTLATSLSTSGVACMKPYQVSPTAMMADAPAQLWTDRASLIQ